MLAELPLDIGFVGGASEFQSGLYLQLQIYTTLDTICSMYFTAKLHVDQSTRNDNRVQFLPASESISSQWCLIRILILPDALVERRDAAYIPLLT